MGERCSEPGSGSIQKLDRCERQAILDLVVYHAAYRHTGTEALREESIGESREGVHLRDAGVGGRVGSESLQRCRRVLGGTPGTGQRLEQLSDAECGRLSQPEIDLSAAGNEPGIDEL